jgi:hypothetical protein
MAKQENSTIISYTTPKTRLTWLNVNLFILAIIHIWALTAEYSFLQLVQRVIDGGTVTFTEASAIDSELTSVWAISIIISIVFLIIFLMWIHRAYRNLRSLGADNLRFTPGWAIGGFFIPLYNFFHPILVIADLWKASDPYIDTRDRLSWKNAPVSFLIMFWWILFLIGFVGGNIYGRINTVSMSIEELYNFISAGMIIEGLGLIYVVVSIALYSKITSRQDYKHSIISDNSSSTLYSEQNGIEQKISQPIPILSREESNKSEKNETTTIEQAEYADEYFDHKLTVCPFCNGSDIYDFVIKRAKDDSEEKALGYRYLWQGSCAKCEAQWHWKDPGVKLNKIQPGRLKAEPNISEIANRDISTGNQDEYCFKCGTKLSSEMVFCPKCGRKLTE